HRDGRIAVDGLHVPRVDVVDGGGALILLEGLLYRLATGLEGESRDATLARQPPLATESAVMLLAAVHLDRIVANCLILLHLQAISAPFSLAVLVDHGRRHRIARRKMPFAPCGWACSHAGGALVLVPGRSFATYSRVASIKSSLVIATGESGMPFATSPP